MPRQDGMPFREMAEPAPGGRLVVAHVPALLPPPPSSRTSFFQLIWNELVVD